jgi:superfamily I DNA/RNA helicase
MIDLSNEFSNDPGQFLLYIKDCQKAAAADSWDGKVVISTVHRLKGLERPVVHVIGCNEGLLPHKSAIEGMPPMGVLPLSSNGRMEDERCIMFVATSRAKEEVHLSHISKWRNKPVNPSRFIGEMGLEAEAIQEEDIDA